MNKYDWLTIPKKMSTILKNIEAQQTIDFDWMIQILKINCNRNKLVNHVPLS